MEVVKTSQFKKDVKLSLKRHKESAKLKEVFDLLVGNVNYRKNIEITNCKELITENAISNRIGCCYTESKAIHCILLEPALMPICSSKAWRKVPEPSFKKRPFYGQT